MLGPLFAEGPCDQTKGLSIWMGHFASLLPKRRRWGHYHNGRFLTFIVLAHKNGKNKNEIIRKLANLCKANNQQQQKESSLRSARALNVNITITCWREAFIYLFMGGRRRGRSGTVY
jgi:hypothetical protein